MEGTGSRENKLAQASTVNWTRTVSFSCPVGYFFLPCFLRMNCCQVSVLPHLVLRLCKGVFSTPVRCCSTTRRTPPPHTPKQLHPLPRPRPADPFWSMQTRLRLRPSVASGRGDPVAPGHVSGRAARAPGCLGPKTRGPSLGPRGHRSDGALPQCLGRTKSGKNDTRMSSKIRRHEHSEGT